MIRTCSRALAIAAVLGACNWGTSPSPELSGVTSTPSSVEGGVAAQGIITLAAAAPSSGVEVALSSNVTAVTVPAAVAIPAGASTASFSIATVPVVAATEATITATYNGAKHTTKLTVMPPTATLTHLAISPAQIPGGLSAQGTVTFSTPAPPGGAVAAVSSDSTFVTVPATVSVTAGAASATFPVNTLPVAAPGTATVTASHNGVKRFATLSLTPQTPAELVALSVTPATVQGGSPAQGTVTLSANAPPHGLTVGLSSNQSAVNVPASIAIAAGATTATFTISTTTVRSSTAATISATYAGRTRTAILRVTGS
jgi:hypothetical protein